MKNKNNLIYYIILIFLILKLYNKLYYKNYVLKITYK